MSTATTTNKILHPKVKPSFAMEDAIRCIKAGIVPFMQSSPGVGKSSIAKEIAKKGNLKLIDCRLSQMAPEDLHGLPMKEMINGRMKSIFLPFDTFPLDTDPIPDGYNGWLLFLDEFNSASKSTQAAAYKLVLDRLVGNNSLHPNCAIIAAGNYASDKAIVNPLSTAMQSRVAHILIDVSHEEWVNWANTNDIDYRVMGYIHFQPTDLHNFNPNHQEMTFPCPRTWEFVSNLVKGTSDLTIMRALLSGVVGPGTAMKFVTFSEEYSRIPKLDDVVKNPTTTPVPRELSTRWAITTMLTSHTNKSNVIPIMEYIKRFRPEEQMIYFRGAIARDNSLNTVPEVRAFLATITRFMHNI